MTAGLQAAANSANRSSAPLQRAGAAARLLFSPLLRQVPPTGSILALAMLGIVNTGVAYWLFYLLIDQAGAATAAVITYVMPVVALFLGVGLLREQLTIGAVAGLLVIGLGAWLATSTPAPSTTSTTAATDTMPSRSPGDPRLTSPRGLDGQRQQRQ